MSSDYNLLCNLNHMQALSRISHKKIQSRRLRYRYKREFSYVKIVLC